MDPAVMQIGLIMLLCETVGTSDAQGPVSVCAEHDYYRVLTSSPSFLDRNCDDRFDITMTPVRKRESYARDISRDNEMSTPVKMRDNNSARPKKKLKGSKRQRKKRKKKRLQEAVKLKKKRKPK